MSIEKQREPVTITFKANYSLSVLMFFFLVGLMVRVLPPSPIYVIQHYDSLSERIYSMRGTDESFKRETIKEDKSRNPTLYHGQSNLA